MMKMKHPKTGNTVDVGKGSIDTALNRGWLFVEDKPAKKTKVSTAKKVTEEVITDGKS